MQVQFFEAGKMDFWTNLPTFLWFWVQVQFLEVEKWTFEPTFLPSSDFKCMSNFWNPKTFPKPSQNLPKTFPKPEKIDFWTNLPTFLWFWIQVEFLKAEKWTFEPTFLPSSDFECKSNFWKLKNGLLNQPSYLPLILSASPIFGSWKNGLLNQPSYLPPILDMNPGVKLELY